MAVVTTNLGVVTAYGEAVNGGYTGTKAEFQEAMNNYAQGITNASEALSTANANTTKIGTLSNLTTTDKTNLVAAVNELDSDVTALNADITANNAKSFDADFISPTWVDGYYLLYDRGTTVETSDYSYAIIPIALYSSLHVDTHIYTSACICFYDSDGEYISGVKNTTETADNYLYSVDLAVPDNAVSIGISCLKAYKDTVNVYSNIQEQIDDLKEWRIEVNTKPSFTRTHRALVWAMNQTNYTVNIIDALNKHGYAVSVTNEDSFVEHTAEWINEYDVLVIGNERGSMPIIASHTPTEVGMAILQWVNAGKGIIYYMLYKSNILSKMSTNASVSSYNLRQVIGDITCETLTVASGTTCTFAHGTVYPNWLGEMIDSNFLSCTGTNAVYNLSADGFSPLITVTAGDTTFNPIIVKDNIAVIGSCGQGDSTASGYWRYIDIGYIADMFVGSEEPKMAFDLDCNKRLCAVSVDGDVTTDTVANQAIIDTWNGCKLEIGLVTSKLTDALISNYRSQVTDVSYLSHTKSHLTESTTKTVTAEVADNGLVMLPNAWFLGDNSYINISAIDAESNALTIVQYVTALTATKCYFDPSLGLMLFHTSLAGTNVTVTYTVINDNAEWVLSEDTMQTTGLPDNKGVYLTAARFSLSPQTLYSAIRKGYILCDHIAQVGRLYTIARGKLLDRVTPLTMPTWYNPFDHTLFDGESYGTTKANAVATVIPNAIQRCIDNNQGIMWYTHDFTVAENDARSIYTENGRWNADWKKSTYEETIANVQDYWESVKTAINAIDHKWVTRSDYSRRYTRLNEDVIYYMTTVDDVPVLYVRNTGDTKISGLTFRYTTSAYTSVTSDVNINHEVDSGVLYMWFDLAGGQTAKITMQA